MPRKRKEADPVAQTLEAILVVLQDLLILEGARSGIRRDDLRRILAVDSWRISRIMRHVKQQKRANDLEEPE
jgi:hypothetical protein